MKHWVNASRHITDFDISPDGKRAVFAARGEVFTVPAKDGSVRNLTHHPGSGSSSGVVARTGGGSPTFPIAPAKTRSILPLRMAWGRSSRSPVDTKASCSRPSWSPDSTKIAWADKDLKLWYVDIKEKKPVEVDRAKYGEIQNYNWSPDSKWLAYDKHLRHGYSVVYSIRLADRKITAVTSTLNNSYAAVFDPGKRYLYFLSDRDYNEVLGNIDFEFANPKTTRVYMATLTADEPSPFPALSDEVKVKTEEPAADRSRRRRQEDARQATKGRRSTAKEKRSRRPTARTCRKISGSIWTASRTASWRCRSAGGDSGRWTRRKDAIYLLDACRSRDCRDRCRERTPAIHAYDLKERKDKVLVEGADQFRALGGWVEAALSRGGGPGAHTYGIIDAKRRHTA